MTNKWKMLLTTTAVIVASTPTFAFFEKTERTEAYTIMPNESAFWIPDVGDTKGSQTKFETEDFLNSNKLAVKRFIIPHQKLTNSGGYLAWDYYVPTGRLVILDRSTYSHEWVDDVNRGSSPRKEGFPCQSKEGLNITVGVSIGTSVQEKDAAKFLYKFGVTPPKGDRTSGEVIFTSVYYGRSLGDVMNDVGRKKVQTLVCNQINQRTFDEANAQAVQIMDIVEKEFQQWAEIKGISLDFIGWANTFEFDKDVQKAVNDRYAAEKLLPVMSVLEALAQLKIQEGLGKGLETKGPPMVITPGMFEAISNIMTKPNPQPQEQPK